MFLEISTCFLFCGDLLSGVTTAVVLVLLMTRVYLERQGVQVGIPDTEDTLDIVMFVFVYACSFRLFVGKVIMRIVEHVEHVSVF